MKIERQQLLDILQSLKVAVSNKGIVQESGCFIFTGSYVVTYNDRISIASPLATDFSCCVPADELLHIVQSSKVKELSIKCSETEMVLSDKKFRAGLALIPNSISEVLPIQNIESLKWSRCKPELFEAIKKCIFSAAKNSPVAYLSCIAINKNTVTSSDNFRISQAILEYDTDIEVLIPVSSAIELASISNITHYSLKDGWMYFKTKSQGYFFCRTVEEQFPDVQALFKISKQATKIQLPNKELKEALQACSVFSTSIDIDKKIQLQISDGKLICKGNNEYGWIEYVVDDTNTPDMNFEIHPDFLLSILEIISEAIIDENKLHIHTENFKHVVALC